MNSQRIYNLSSSISHHNNILRTVSCNKVGLVCTGAFDKQCSFFQSSEDGSYVHVKDTHYHDDYIYVVRSDIKDRGFFSGSKDKRIVYMDNTGNPLGEFLGHEGTVCSISQNMTDNNLFISGSWDTTAKVWDIEKQEIIFNLPGHAYAVTTLALPNKKYVTGSQDKTLRFWDCDKNIISIPNAHEDIIRDIILGPDNESIYTCSNDCIIKQWGLNGMLLNTFNAHEAFIFSICYDQTSNQLFSCSDDKLVKIWTSAGGFLQSLNHPNTVWDAVINPINGDLITACADHMLRVFSYKQERWMPQKALEEYNNLCKMADQQGEEEGTGEEVDISKLPKVEEMFTMTNVKNGEIRLFNNNGKGEAYLYKQNEKRWELLGEVLGQKKEEKKHYPGDNVFAEGDYDFIFDVELEGRISQLPFNEGGNALVAAEKFVGREKLHKNYIDDITKFLRANGTKKRRKKPVISEEKKKSPQSAITKAQAQSNKPQVTSHFSFPIMMNYLYDTVNSEGPIKKIVELNNSIAEGSPNKKLSEFQIKQITKVIKIIGEKNFYHNSTFDENELKEFISLITDWHDDFLIPIFDVYRMFLLHPDCGQMFKGVGGGMAEYAILREHLKNIKNQTLTILAIRVIVNHFNNDNSKSFIKSKRQEILDLIGNFVDNENKHIRNGICNLLFNFSILFCTNEDSEAALQIMALINEILPKEANNDNLTPLLKALANLLVIVDNHRLIGKDMDIEEVVNGITNANEIVQELKAYVLALLK